MSIGTENLAVHFQRDGTGGELLIAFRNAGEGNLVADYDAARGQLMAYNRVTRAVAVWTLPDIQTHLERAWFSNADWARSLRTTLSSAEQAQIDFNALASRVLLWMAGELGAVE